MNETNETPFRHQDCQQRLPWYVNDSLDPVERARVELHLDTCAACRAELEHLTELESVVRSAPARVPSNIATCDELFDRIDGRVAKGADGSTSLPVAVESRRSPQWMRAVMVAQAAALVVLAVVAFAPRGGSSAGVTTTGFRLLSDRSAAAPIESHVDSVLLRVVFDEATSESELRELLLDIGGEVVAGPTPVGAYTLRVDAPSNEVGASDRDAVLNDLRADARVRFVEPI